MWLLSASPQRGDAVGYYLVINTGINTIKYWIAPGCCVPPVYSGYLAKHDVLLPLIREYYSDFSHKGTTIREGQYHQPQYIVERLNIRLEYDTMTNRFSGEGSIEEVACLERFHMAWKKFNTRQGKIEWAVKKELGL